MFGGLEIRRGQAPLPRIPTHKARSLLAYLALHRNRAIHRDVLCGLHWGDQTDAEARKALRTTLWRIRSALEPTEEFRGAFLQVEGPHVRFPGTGFVWVDVSEFEASLDGAQTGPPGQLPAEQAERLAHAVSLYQGDLLEGHYDDWCSVDRERLRLGYHTALERLLAHHRARGEWLAAISAGRQLLRTDPIREHVHRELMACHLSMGDRPSALRQYEICERLVRDEMGIPPMEETRRLYGWIRDHGTLPPPEGTPGPDPAPEAGPEELASEVDLAVRRLQSLLDRLEASRTQAIG